jgi:hypothetical protein
MIRQVGVARIETGGVVVEDVMAIAILDAE